MARSSAPSACSRTAVEFKDGKATFLPTQWRGLQAPGKEEERAKWPFLVNNGRTNIVWQSAYLDQDNEFVMDRFPYAFIQMNPDDMAELKLKQGDLVEVYNDSGSTQGKWSIRPPPPNESRLSCYSRTRPACRET